MATPGRPIDDATRQRIVRLVETLGYSARKAARVIGISKRTADKYVRLSRKPTGEPNAK